MGRLLAALAVLAGLVVVGGRADAELPTGYAAAVTQRDLVQPTSMAIAPDGRLFVAEQRGTIQTYDSVDDATPELFADLRTQVHAHHDRGLLSIEVDRQWPERPHVYALYSYDAPPGGVAPTYGAAGQDSDPCPGAGCTGQTRIARLTADANPAVVSQTVLVSDVCRQFQLHDGGGLRQGPDGSLWAGLGEGAWPYLDHGQYGDPPNPCGDPVQEGGSMRAQDVRTSGDPLGLSGTVLRLDPDGGTEPQIEAVGLRNPFRLAVRDDGELWVGDVGATAVEELNHLDPAGPQVNFGWPCYEGPERHRQFDEADLPVCEALYASSEATPPADFYCHATGPDGGCEAGSGRCRAWPSRPRATCTSPTTRARPST